MSERRNSNSSPSISDSAGCVFRVEHLVRSEIAAISPFVDELMLFIKKCRCVPGGEIDVEVSLREALANAVIHGNRENPHKHVYVSVDCVPDKELSILVRDEGKGFTAADLPNPTATDQLESAHGRGVYLMKTLMDEVQFEQGGAEVRMRKKACEDC